jgi:hypothetical protein
MKNLLLLITLLLLGATKSLAQLPSGWLHEDIGTVGGTGTASESSGTYTLSDRGSLIGDKLDSFHLAYRHVLGDGTLIARVATTATTDPQAQAGICWRETLRPWSKGVCVVVTPRSVELIYRKFTREQIEVPLVGARTNPTQYLKIVRSGYNFTGSYSPDGITYTSLGTVRTTIIGKSIAGLATSSHDSATLRAVTFDNVTPPATSDGLHYYASPIAVTGSGSGTWTSPYSLQDVCRQTSNPITSGSTLWLLGLDSTGAPTPYPAKLECYIANADIRSYPGDPRERAVIDGYPISKFHFTADVASSGCVISVSTADYLVPGVKISVPNDVGTHEDIRVINPMVGTNFNSCIRGDNGTPISAYPAGREFSMFDSILKIKGANSRWWDIEIMSSDKKRVGTGYPYLGGDTDYWPTYRGPAYSIQATGVGVLFPVAHDAMEGYSNFSFAGASAYGGVYFNGGLVGGQRTPNGGHGHGFYIQGEDPSGTTLDSLTSVLAFSAAMKAGTVNGAIDYVTIRNSMFGGGGGNNARGGGADNCQVTFEMVSDGKRQINDTADNNTVWINPRCGSQAVDFGYTAANNKNGVFTNNLILGGARGLYYRNWQSLIATGNTVLITNGNGSWENEMLQFRYGTQGAAAGHAVVNGTTVDWADGDKFNSSWGTGCQGCPTQIKIVNTFYNISSVTDDGRHMTIASSAGSFPLASWNVGGTEGHPVSLTVNNNNYYSAIGLDFNGTIGTASETRRYYHWNKAEPNVSVLNKFGTTLLKFHPDCVAATQEDRSWQRWTNADPATGTGIVNRTGTSVTWVSGTPFNIRWAGLQINIAGTLYTISSVPTCTTITLSSGGGSDSGASYSITPPNYSTWTDGIPTGATIKWYQTTDNESGYGYVGNLSITNWQLASSVTVPASTFNGTLLPGDRFQVINAQNWEGRPILEGTFTGADLALPMTDLTITPARGLGYNPKSSLPFWGPFIVRRL